MNPLFDEVVSRFNTQSVKWDKYEGTNILPMWVADMDFPTAPAIHAAIQNRIAHPVYGYTAPPSELVSTVCSMLQLEYGWTISPEWLVWLPGTLPGVAAGCSAFADENEEIAINIPAFSEFFKVVRQSKRNALTIPLKQVNERWTFDFQLLRKTLTSRTRVLLLCSPNNPTGTVFIKDELAELCQICDDLDITIISDEIHAGLVLDPTKRHTPTAMSCGEHTHNIVTLMSASKTYNLSGINCAYAIISSKCLRDKFISKCEGFGIMPMAAALPFSATLAAYRDSNEWHTAMIDYLWGNYKYLESRLSKIDKIKLSPLEATYLAWLDISALKLPSAVQYLERYGIGVSSGDWFGDSRFVRINFACSRKKLETAMDCLEHAVRDRAEVESQHTPHSNVSNL